MQKALSKELILCEKNQENPMVSLHNWLFIIFTFCVIIINCFSFKRDFEVILLDHETIVA